MQQSPIVKTLTLVWFAAMIVTFVMCKSGVGSTESSTTPTRASSSKSVIIDNPELDAPKDSSKKVNDDVNNDLRPLPSSKSGRVFDPPKVPQNDSVEKMDPKKLKPRTMIHGTKSAPIFPERERIKEKPDSTKKKKK